MLLLDPAHEDMFDFLPPEAAALNERMKPDPTQLPDLTAEQITAVRDQYAQLYATWPESVRGPLIEHHLTAWRTGLVESANLESELYGEVRHGGPLPDVPLIVVTAMGRNAYWAQHVSAEQLRQLHEGIAKLHASIAASVRRGEHRVLPTASHQTLHIEQPDAVVQAVRELSDQPTVGRKRGA